MSKDAKSFMGWLSLAGLFIATAMIWVTVMQDREGQPKAVAPEEVAESVTPTPDPVEIVFLDGVPTAVGFNTPTATSTPKPTHTPTSAPTATDTPTPKPTNTPKPTATNTPKPTSTPKPAKAAYTRGTPGTRVAETNGKHGWKPWARHTAVTDKTSPQWRLEQIATTDELGRRIVKDANGEWRYLVALPVYWAGGTFSDIGRCVDIKMANGAVLKCVLADIKKIEHSLNGEGKYGAKGEVIEVICDKERLIEAVLKSGDASRFGAEWQGDVKSVTALEMFIEF